MRFREKVELLFALAQSHAEWTAAAEGQEGLRDLKPGVRRILPWGKKRHEPLASITGTKHQHEHDRNRAEAQGQEMGYACASEKAHPDRHQSKHHNRPKIRLEQYQSAQQADHNQSRHKTIPKQGDLVPLFCQIRRHINDRHELDQFRRLNRQRSQPQPSPRSLRRHTERRHQHHHEQHQDANQQRNGELLPNRVIDARREMHQQKPEGEPGDLSFQEEPRILKPVASHDGTRAEHHDKSHQRQDHGDRQQRMVRRHPLRARSLAGLGPWERQSSR